jgi:phosphatidate cytidylyltransferase
MALNLKTFGVRTLSAIVFGTAVIGSLYWNYYSCTILFFIAAMIGLGEFYNLMEKMEAKPFRNVGFVAGFLLYFSFVNTPYTFLKSDNLLFPFLAGFPFVIFSLALFSKRENPFQAALYTLIGLIYVVLPFALIHELVFIYDIQQVSRVYFPKLIFGVLLLIWCNDTFAYIGGSLFGRHKLLERISPGKTWEGSIFGLLLTFILSFVIRKFLFETSFNMFVLLGILVPILANIGDLLESMLKRQAGVKDSGNIMPGHGGILDRFDSLIFVLPFIYVLLKAGPLLFGN